MGRKGAGIAISSAIARLAEPQGGVVSRRQLLAAGISPRMIDRRVAGGALRIVHRGVYALAHRRLDRLALHHAASLAAGEFAAISHRDALGHWRMRPESRGPVHVTVPGVSGRRPRRGIVVHRAPLLDGDSIHRGQLRVTSPGRTLVDAAAILGRREVERALDEAHYLGLVSETTLVETLDRNAGRPGTRALRRVLHGHELGSTRTESALEEMFVEAYRTYGRHTFRTQARLAPYRADLFFPAHRLLVEVDGPAHRLKRRREQDAVRDQVLADRGLRTIRVTDEEMDSDIRAAVDRVDRELRQRAA